MLRPSEMQDGARAARAAKLRYVDDEMPGFRRRNVGTRARPRFRYVGVDGRPLRDPATLDRIARLAIPPAWTSVWISPAPDGHIQATGRDARGRKQYRYHERWRAYRDETKYERVLAFAQALPKIRAAVDAALREPGLTHAKVLAAVVRLLELTLIRVGYEEYARENRSFGLTSLRSRHVDVAPPVVHFQSPQQNLWVSLAARVGRRARDTARFARARSFESRGPFMS